MVVHQKNIIMLIVIISTSLDNDFATRFYLGNDQY